MNKLGEYKILIVEDDRSLNQGIVLALRQEKLVFYQAFSLREARDFWKDENVNMVLLDINLPDGSGYDLLREIRRYSEIPVLMITANDMEVDEVTGFSLGADDYITKPFSLMVLRARVERMKKRSEQKDRTDLYQDQEYVFSFDGMRFQASGQEVMLSKTEQKLLRILTANPGQTLPRERLLELIWPDGTEYVDANALSVAVNRLRKKLEINGEKSPIQTVYGLGYAWERKQR
ncbi:MAG: response regulator transcription factor [Oliverpabstia sp.]